MRSSFVRSRFIEVLSETPLINHACKKVGVARSTIYRWLKDIPEFKEAVENALRTGRENVGEIAESKIMKMIHEGDFKAIRYYLDNNNPRYMPKRTTFVIPKKHKHILEPGERCFECAHVEPAPRTFEEEKKFREMFRKVKYTREMYEEYLKDFFSKTPKGRKMWERIKGKKKD